LHHGGEDAEAENQSKNEITVAREGENQGEEKGRHEAPHARDQGTHRRGGATR
jgi:hypothetical protein